jgi:hypothetical protein
VSEPTLQLAVGGATLTAVPAVHFRLAFAERVNRLCASARPEAIAVELGPETAAAAAECLRDLGVGPKRRQRLPCMIALTRANRRIRASLRERAARLQLATGKDLHELPPELLKELLGYSAVTVLYLSPTDSIIEAVRCALELGVPLYGVDLDETADAQRPATLVQDPALASDRVEAYVRRNARYAEHQRDEEIDHRREVAMAARLKEVLGRHRNVLFTGGLAHWPRLQALLQDPQVRPAPVRPAAEIHPDGFTRAVVHPLLAVYHLDVFPAFAEAYETHRRPADEPRGGTTKDLVKPAELFAEMLQAAYAAHFRPEGPEEQLDRRLEDWEARPDFEQLLGNLCIVSQVLVPDLFTALAAAEGTMSPAFCGRLADVLMRFPWAAPDDFPELPLLAPAPAGAGDYLRAEFRHGRQRGRYFYIDARPGSGSYRVKVKIPWEWQRGGGGPPPPISDINVVWPPQTYFFAAMSLRAVQVARTQRDRVRVEAFEGSLGDGLAVKATLRAQARGDDRVFIRDVRVQRKRQSPRADEWDPVAWIFRPGHADGSDWEFMGETLDEFAQFVRDPARLRGAERELGRVMVEQVGYGRRRERHQFAREARASADRGLAQVITECLDLQGMLLYSSCHFSLAQNAAWAEDTDLARNPVCSYDVYNPRGRYFSDPIRRMFRERHGLELDVKDWTTSLVRMAIPFARRAVTVVAPDRFALPAVVYQEARRRGVEVLAVPHSYFPREALRRLARWLGAPSVPGTNGEQFPEVVCRAFGEAPTANRHLLPPYWRDYGRAGGEP